MDLFDAAGINVPRQAHLTGERPMLSVHLVNQTVKLTPTAQISAKRVTLDVPCFMIKFNYRTASVHPSDQAPIVHLNNANNTTIARRFEDEDLLLRAFLGRYALLPITGHTDLEPAVAQHDLYIYEHSLDPMKAGILFHRIRSEFNRNARSNITIDRLYPIKDLKPMSAFFQAKLVELQRDGPRSFHTTLMASFQTHEENVLPSVLTYLKENGESVYDAAINLKAEITLTDDTQLGINLTGNDAAEPQDTQKPRKIRSTTFMVVPHNGALLHLTKPQLTHALDTIINSRIISAHDEVPLSRAVALAASEGFTATEELNSLFETAQTLTSFARDNIDVTPTMPESVLATPRQGQGTALALMQALFQLGLGCLLADTMSAGKTYMTLGHCHRLRAGGLIKGNILYITTPNHKTQLGDKCSRLFKETTFTQLDRSTQIELNETSSSDLRVLIATHDDVHRYQDRLSKISFDIVIIDEAHKLNSLKSQARDAIASLTRQQTILATGTPFNNKTADLYSLIDLAAPGLLGNPHQFQKTFAIPIKNGDGSTLQAFAALISPFFLMRNEEQLGLKLPTLIPETIYVKTSKALDKHHNALVNELLLFSEVNSVSTMTTRSQFRHLYLKIHLFASHPEAVVPFLTEAKGFTSPKLAKILTQAKASIADGRPFIIFANSVPFLCKIHETLVAHGLAVGLCTGQQTPSERRKTSSEFTNGKFDGLVLSLKANNEAIEYPTARTVILAESWYNPFAEDQAIFRARRTSNLNSDIKLFRILTGYPIEQRIIELARGKRTLGNLLLAAGAFDTNEESVPIDEAARFAKSLMIKRAPKGHPPT